jgi:tetratricopeptide (TPR) repeat protein
MNASLTGIRLFGAVVVCSLVGCQTPLLPGRPDGAPGGVNPQKQNLDQELAAAAALEREQQTDRAIVAYSDIVRRVPDCSRAHHRLAVSYSRQGRFQEADSHYEAALRLEPQNADILADLAYSQYLAGRLPQAESTLRKALETNPGAIRCHANLGLVLAHTGRQRESLDAFARSGCGEAQAHINLGYALLSDRQWPDAEIHLAYAARLDPASKPAADGLAMLRHCQGARQTQPAAHDANIFQTAYRDAGGAPPTSASAASPPR